MPEPVSSVSRRNFLAAASASMVVGAAAAAQESAQTVASKTRQRSDDKPLRVAAVNSVYRLRSHAYHICGRLIHGYTRNGFHHQPALQLVRMYNDQVPKDDLGEHDGKLYGVEISKTVADALGGKNGLDVDAVLLIIEHGDYPSNDRQQILYPRFELFQQIVDVFQKSGRSVPVFVDKHLSYDHHKAAKMVQTAREMGFGLMAGSSLPVTWRVPEIEPPLETPFQEGLVTYGFDRGVIDVYLFHALESLQCMMERRRGGEAGVKSVQCLQGDAVWKACDAGRWSRTLMEAALRHCDSNNVGPVRENVLNPLAVLIEFNDGARGAVLNLIEQTSEFGFAGVVKDRPELVSTCLFLPAPPAANFFNPLTWNIERFFLTGQSPYPVERTLLTSTLCDLAMRSLHENSRVVSSPALDIRYQSVPDSGFFRGSTKNGV